LLPGANSREVTHRTGLRSLSILSQLQRDAGSVGRRSPPPALPFNSFPVAAIPVEQFIAQAKRLREGAFNSFPVAALVEMGIFKSRSDAIRAALWRTFNSFPVAARTGSPRTTSRRCSSTCAFQFFPSCCLNGSSPTFNAAPASFNPTFQFFPSCCRALCGTVRCNKAERPFNSFPVAAVRFVAPSDATKLNELSILSQLLLANTMRNASLAIAFLSILSQLLRWRGRRRALTGRTSTSTFQFFPSCCFTKKNISWGEVKTTFNSFPVAAKRRRG